MRVFIIYLFSYISLSIYGGQVCPFIESLGFIHFSVQMLIFFFVFFVIRLLLSLKILKTEDILEKPKRQFYLEFMTFISMGIGIMIYNSIVYNFPLESGLKVVIGTATLGMFAGLDLSLKRTRDILISSKNEKITPSLKDKYSSFIKKFSIISIIVTVLFIGVILLVLIKDLSWIVEVGRMGLKKAVKYVVLEIFFLVGVISLLIVNLIISYSKNLKLLFKNLTEALIKVTNGNLEVNVPVISYDELGLIAKHANIMVDGLKEKDIIKNIFGKAVSPEVADILIKKGKEGIKLGGSRRDVVILIADIRNFTAISEKKEAEEVVSILNNYFAKVVEIINKNGGVLDKFIGDGFLSVFGFKDFASAADNAVSAAVSLLDEVKKLNEKFNFNFEIGVGINSGSAISGIIGSPDRLEFTVIGDTVNAAARLEELTKELDANLLISSNVLELFNNNSVKNLNWKDFGQKVLRGKNKAIQVFGLKI